MVDFINATHSLHIVTVEDPIEFVFKPQKSIVSQREIGIDVPDYAEALKYVVRQDPNVIFIGELRDAITMNAALQAAETGKHQVEDDDVVLAELGVGEALLAVARNVDGEPGAVQPVPQGALKRLRVLDDQDLHVDVT